MKNRISLAHSLQRDALKWVALSCLASLIVFVPIVLSNVKSNAESTLAVQATAAVYAYRQVILGGNVRRAENEIRTLLQLEPTEGVAVLDTDGKTYRSSNVETFEACPSGPVCWLSAFGPLGITLPIYFDSSEQHLFGYLAISKNPKINYQLIGFLFGGLAFLQILFLVGYTSGVRRIGTDLSLKLESLSSEVRRTFSDDAHSTSESIEEFESIRTAASELSAQVTKLKSEGLTEDVLRQVAHDIRGPLSAIGIAVKMSPTLPQDIRNLLQQSYQRIEAISKDILVQKDSRPAKTGESIDKLLIPLIEEKRFSYQGLALAIEVEEPLPVVGPAMERTTLTRILSNLIDNSVQAQANKIKIAVTAAGKSLKITIGDNGVGIAPTIKERIFAKGFTTKENGNGLGLSHSKKEIEQNGGEISFESSPGHGTVFTIQLPINEA